MPSSSRQAEHPHRQPPDGAGDAIAIEIERRHVGRADVLRHVHLHAVDDGEEILALQAEGLHRGDVVLQPRRRMALIERVDVVAPLLKRGEPLVARAVGIGDVVDLAAEAVDLEHRLALVVRQDAHRRIERAAGCGRAVIGAGRGRLKRHAPAAGLGNGACGRSRGGRLRRHAGEAESEQFELGQMHALAQGIAHLQQAHDLVGKGLDHRRRRARAGNP